MEQAILLDTNVLSELMRPQPDVQVLAWFGLKTEAGYYTSAVTKSEILLGISLLSAGKRQVSLANAAVEMFSKEFTGRCLPFDEQSAAPYAELVSARTRAGQPISTEDAQIAAIAITNHFCLATRNVKDFTGIAGLVLVNPWDAT